MTLPPALSRRRLMAAAATAGGAGMIGCASLGALHGDRSLSLGGYRVLAEFCADLPCTDAISQACLRALPTDESSPQRLASLILGGMSSTSRRHLAAGTLHHAIRVQSRRDFARGDIVTVDGWMLSRTEVRLYALAALFGRG
jgi:hypothetical protein